MNRVHIDEAGLPDELRKGVACLRAEFPWRFDPGGLPVRFQGGLNSGESWLLAGTERPVLHYRNAVHAWRGLGRLLGAKNPTEGESETEAFSLLGVMLDVSRNGVPTVAAVKSMLCRFALMGINTVFLYTEDIYEIEGEPFWGYLRGAYGCDELKEVDQFAADLGVEIIPCVQTLAHLEQVLQWPAYRDLRDTDRVLMAGEERTYALIEKIISTMASCFRSKRIHLGMDEAHGIGKGNYLKKHGAKGPFAILRDHLGKVEKLCRAHGLRPMIWSDMYFRLGSARGDYYDPASVIPDWARDGIPPNVDLVYWDYYHTAPGFYRDWIERHRALGKDPILAAGAWTWNRFWAALPHAFATIDASMPVAKEKGLREAFVTAWGDDGSECDPYSMLPAVQRFAEHGYRAFVDEARLTENFAGSCGVQWGHWVRAADVDAPAGRNGETEFGNIGKLLLWQDPALALFDPLVDEETYPDFYAGLARELEEASKVNRESARLLFPAKLASVLELKSVIRRQLCRACQNRDRERLEELATRTLPELRRRVDDLWREHRAWWMSSRKPFGWEVIEARYGCLRTRLDTVLDRVRDYLAGRLDNLPELEAKLHPVETESGLPFDHSRHSRAFTPSWLK